MYTILGGTLVPSSIELNITGELPVSAEKCADNAEQNKRLGLKTYREWRTDKTRLAVLGGGPSINDNAEEIKNFDGDIWAINGAWNWCRDRGIKATFFACDPHHIVMQWAGGADKALLELSCDPAAFAKLKGADVYTFDADQENGGIVGYASTASCAPHLAIRMGYRSVKFFGCESSYLPNKSHAYMDEDRKEQMIVRCGNHDFLTAPDLFLQAIGLSQYIRELPEFLSNEDGGLLTAMVENPGYNVTWMSQGLVDLFGGNEKSLVVSPAYKGNKVSGAVAMADNLEAFGLTEKDIAA